MKIKKRNKLLSVCLILVLAACATIGGVLAMQEVAAESEGLMTMSTTEETNSGVTLITQQRAYNADGTLNGLEPYKDNTMIYPLVGSAQYNGENFDKYGMPTAEGYVDQIVTLKNSSSSPLYVRVLVAIPKALEDREGNSSKNALHWNLGNRFMPEGTFSKDNDTNTDFANYETPDFLGVQTKNGTEYNVYAITYKNTLAAGAKTGAAAIVGFYLDKDVNIKNGKVYLDGKYTGYQGDTVDIAVKAQAVHADGFTDKNNENGIDDEALAALAQMSTNPWVQDANNQ